MPNLTISYQHNTSPHRGLAATGIILIKLVLAAPHLIVSGALQTVAMWLAYFGYWLVAFTGSMPQAVHRLLEISFQWNTRIWGWIAGITDVYPPFETDPEYPVEIPVAKPENPSQGWAVAGIFVAPKFLVAIPHFVVLVFLGIGAVLAMWFGFIVAAVTGRLPAGIQDYLVGVLQWQLRVFAWIAGLVDEYPPFSLDAAPSPAAGGIAQ